MLVHSDPLPYNVNSGAEMPAESEFLSLKEAQAYLGVSKTKMWRLVKSGSVRTYEDPLDSRKKLVRREDAEELKRPRPTGGCGASS